MTSNYLTAGSRQAPLQPMDEQPVYDNRSLFSDYYLKERLGDHAEWSEDVMPVFEAARRLYHEKREVLDGLDEARTKEEFTNPLLRDVLGFDFEVQTPATRQGRLNRPDYALFTRPQAKTAAQRLHDHEAAYYTRAAAVADAKYWGRPLDRQVDDPRDELSNANPSFQIVNYLVTTGVDWGVLTNGRLWRLYYARARSRVDTYFEVDLARILESGDADAFRYFYLFFRASAFEKDPQTDQSFLEAVHEGSVNYGTELEKRLKDVIFEQIFVYLATGFLEYRRTNGGIRAETQDSLNEIYQGTLRLLYRLLFLLHAEARGLLPVDDRHGNYRYSLTRIKRDVADRLDRGVTLSTVSDDIWNDLAGLFRIIDRGDPALNVPQHNGGLFRQDDPKNAFLNTHRIPDAYLAPALDLLTREHDPETGQHRFIDYKTLNVEQLGSIYEGLLEFHLEIRDSRPVLSSVEGLEIDSTLGEGLLTEPQSPRSGDFRRTEISNLQSPISNLQSPIYLVNDEGERKATGSYYTPHYIVEYIVEHTLGPVLEERAARFRELMAEIKPQRERLREIQEKLAADSDRADACLPSHRQAWVSRWQNEAQGLRRELDGLGREAVEALLGVRVCDPAMGSGHFLVYAADWLAEHLIAVLSEFPDNPVLRRIAGIRQQIVDELTRQGIAIDAERLKDTNLLKRMVMKRCIYGVDLNPMATELAKLSLWLDSFTVGAPLSFLDHHLKVGNSLIGAQVEEVRQALGREDTGQVHMFGGPFAGLLTATSLMRDVAARTDATFEEVEQSAEKYAAFETAMLPYKRVLDLWVSRHFGNTHAEEFLRLYSQEALQAVVNKDVDLAPEYHEAVDKARALWHERRFFHWELEFPEVFVDVAQASWKENPGFDVMVGNPPYQFGENIPADDKPFLENGFALAHGQYDTYWLFYEQALTIISAGGFHGHIVPDALLARDEAEALRNELLSRTKLRAIAPVGAVFEDPNVSAVVTIWQQSPPNSNQVQIWHRNGGDLYLKGVRSQSLLAETPRRRLWVSLDACEFDLVMRIIQGSTLLRNYLEVSRGEELGKKDLRPIGESRTDGVPILVGEDISPLSYPEPTHSASATLLTKDDRNYRANKIVLVKTGKNLVATVDPVGHITLQSVYNLNVKPDHQVSTHYLAALLKSDLLSYFLRATVTRYKQIFPQLNQSTVEEIPIRRIKFTTPADTRAALLEKGKRLYGQCVEKDDAASVLGFVEEQLAHEPERADVVHDLLAFLAERLIELHKQRQRVEKALDPFKFLDRGAPFVSLPDAFADEIKRDEFVRQTSEASETSEVSRPIDLGAAHHDIDGLRLMPAGDRWELQVQLKLRDPAQDWQSWQYGEGGHTIAREWVPAYRLPLDPEKARYYQHAFQVLDQFANARSFPGGYTRTTMKKLQLTRVPAYDPTADLTPLVELLEELASVRDRIARTDALIDQIVYCLYRLTEEEVAVMEGRAKV